MPKARIGIALFVGALLTACGGNYADLNLERYAVEKEIIGRWSLGPHTLELAKRDGYAPAAALLHEIVFFEDGTCDFRSITEFAHKATYLEYRGSWKLAHDTGAPTQKKKKNEVSIRIKDRGISLYLMEEKGRLVLWDFWGDPDACELLRYEKKG